MNINNSYLSSNTKTTLFTKQYIILETYGAYCSLLIKKKVVHIVDQE